MSEIRVNLPNYFEAYFEYAKEISLLFKFDFDISEETDYVLVEPIGIKVPVYSRDPDKVIYVVDAVANEILGYKNPEIHQLGIGVTRKRDSEYFDAFRDKYNNSQGGEYQYVVANK